jgi:hypothetical protein
MATHQPPALLAVSGVLPFEASEFRVALSSCFIEIAHNLRPSHRRLMYAPGSTLVQLVPFIPSSALVLSLSYLRVAR